MRLIILAAGQGTRLRPLTNDRPKCLIGLGGKPLLSWQIEAARAVGIDDIVVVGGYRLDQLNGFGVRVVANPLFAETNMVRTLFYARQFFGDAFIMSYGDIAYGVDVMKALVTVEAPIGVVVDKDWLEYWKMRFDDPLSDAETLTFDCNGYINNIGSRPRSIDEIAAQYIGLVSFRAEGVKALTAAYDAYEVDNGAGIAPVGGERNLDRLYMTDLLQGLINRGERLTPVPINGGWVEIDRPTDIDVAEKLLSSGRLGAQTK